MAITIDAGNRRDVWIYDLLRLTSSRLTFDTTGDRPLWTPDGKRVVFRDGPNGAHLFWRTQDGTGQAQRLTSAPNPDRTAMSFSPDGRKLVFVQLSDQSGHDVHVLDIEEPRSSKPLLQTTFSEGSPVISPDGRWLAYRSNESGRYEIYVRPFPDVDKRKWLISTNGGNAPVWSPDARELFYQIDGKMMAVAVHDGDDFAAGQPKVLFTGSYLQAGGGTRQFDIARDGQRFIMIKEIEPTVEASARDELTIVLNWFEELRQLAVSGK